MFPFPGLLLSIEGKFLLSFNGGEAFIFYIRAGQQIWRRSPDLFQDFWSVQISGA
jgi:hypothetical protein